MYCIGWKAKSNCRPVIETEMDYCPGIPLWFLGLVVGAGAWVLGKRGGK